MFIVIRRGAKKGIACRYPENGMQKRTDGKPCHNTHKRKLPKKEINTLQKSRVSSIKIKVLREHEQHSQPTPHPLS